MVYFSGLPCIRHRLLPLRTFLFAHSHYRIIFCFCCYWLLGESRLLGHHELRPSEGPVLKLYPFPANGPIKNKNTSAERCWRMSAVDLPNRWRRAEPTGRWSVNSAPGPSIRPVIKLSDDDGVWLAGLPSTPSLIRAQLASAMIQRWTLVYFCWPTPVQSEHIWY